MVGLRAAGNSGIACIVAAFCLVFPGTAASAQIEQTPDSGGPGVLDLLLIVAGIACLIALWTADVIRPGSFRRRGSRIISPWPWWIWGLGAFLTLVSGSLAAGFAGGLVRSTDELTQLAVMSFAGGTVSSAVAYVLLTRGLPAIWGIPAPAPMGTRVRFTGRAILVGLGALLLAFPVVMLASIVAVVTSTMITGKQPDRIAHETLRALVDHPADPAVWTLIFVAVIVAPVSEELFFRGLLQSTALRVLGSSWAAVLLVSAFFALVHVGGGLTEGQEHAVGPIFVLGVAMGIAYERTRNLAIPIVMHMGFNAVNVVLAVVQH